MQLRIILGLQIAERSQFLCIFIPYSILYLILLFLILDFYVTFPSQLGENDFNEATSNESNV